MSRGDYELDDGFSDDEQPTYTYLLLADVATSWMRGFLQYILLSVGVSFGSRRMDDEDVEGEEDESVRFVDNGVIIEPFNMRKERYVTFLCGTFQTTTRNIEIAGQVNLLCAQLFFQQRGVHRRIGSFYREP
jgi:hypothetical protein